MIKRGSESDTLRGVHSFRSPRPPVRAAWSLQQQLHGLASITQALSVSENTQPNQRVDHCVGTRPANKDNLSAPVGSPLLLAAAAVTENRGHGHISLPLPSRGGAG